MQKLVFTLSFLLLTVFAFAQAPQLFNYQGLARDAAGTPFINQGISIRISIIQNSPSGQVVFQETHNSVTNSVGIFSIKVGAGTPNINTLADVNWGNGEHYLKTELDALGGTNYEMVGITQLISAPYALYANNGSKWEDESTGLFYDRGYIRIGQEGLYHPNPYNLHLVGYDNEKTRFTIESKNKECVGIHIWRDTDNAPSGIAQGATIGYKRNSDILKINNGNSFFNQSHLTINKQGNIGVGTDNPQARLQVEDGDIYLEEIGRGVIMKSPNGNCWRVTIDNDGNFVKTVISCP